METLLRRLPVRVDTNGGPSSHGCRSLLFHQGPTWGPWSPSILGVDVFFFFNQLNGMWSTKTAMSWTGWWFGTWLDYFHSWDDFLQSDFHSIIFQDGLNQPTKHFMICWLRSPAKSGRTLVGRLRKVAMPTALRVARPWLVQSSPWFLSWVSADSPSKKRCCELPPGKRSPKTMERSTMFQGKTHEINGNFQ